MARFLVFTLLLVTQLAFSQAAGFQFIENKNQWPSQVAYKADLRSGYLYLEKNGFLYNLYDAHAVNKYVKNHFSKETNFHKKELGWHSFRVSFLNCNSDVKILGKQQTKAYYNYFLGNNPNNWAEKAFGYHKISYQNIYNGIDLNYYSQLFNLKYDFIVSPTGNVSDIQLNYTGADKLEIKNNRLHIYTKVNHIIEDQPYAYQIIEGEKIEIECNYKLSNNILSFHFPNGYNKKFDVVIDPTLIFSTYSGSLSNNFGYSATFDSKGFLYSGSSAFGNNYPTTIGAYNTSWNAGIVDIAISKFDTTGTSLLYSTYIGGNSDEVPHSLIVNSFDELFILGTTSSFNYPYTTNCYDSTFNGGTANNLTNGLGIDYSNGSDIVISHLSADGTSLLGSTFIGGSLNDGLNSTSSIASQNILRYNYADEIRGEIDIDQNNNIYVVSCTQSSDFPTTSNVFQPVYGGGNLDACVFKLDNNLENLIWSSYIGGENHDAAYSLSIDSNQDLYITGGTSSTLFPTTSSALDTSFKGGRSDGFISHINQNGQTILSSSFFGSGSYDQSYFVELDRFNNVYLLGQTEIQDSTFIQNVGWSIPGSGQFISKLNPSLDSIVYSTVFGGGNGINISPTAFLVDLCNKMYLAGWGGSVNNLPTLDNNAGFTNNMPITFDAFQSTTDGSDFYIMVLEDDASGLVYGSYFGGGSSAEHVDGGTSRFDRKGKVYQAVCAGCGGFSDLPIEPTGAFSSTNNSNCNLGVFKMDFDLPVVLADFDTPPIGCEPYTYTFNNTSIFQNNTSFYWDFGDNSTSSSFNPTHTFTSAGTYDITLIIQDTATCNFGDTISRSITVLGDTSYQLSDVDLCPGESVQIGLTPNPNPAISYLWSPALNLSDTAISNPFCSPTSSGSYTLFISNGICVDTVTQNINVNTPLLSLPADTTLCSDTNSFTITANSFGTSNQYIWSTENQFLDTINSSINSPSITVSPATNTTYYVQINNNGCELSDSINVLLANSGTQSSSDTIICLEDSVMLTIENLFPNDTLIYDWQPSALISPDNTNDTIWVSPSTTTTFYVQSQSLISGCITFDSIIVIVDTLSNLNTSVSSNFDTVPEGGNASLLVLPNGYAYDWSPIESLSNSSIQNPIASPENTTTYYVTISGQACTKTDSIIIYVSEIICGPPYIYLPNAFTPNQDNKNDLLLVRGNYILDEEFVFRIFDRWGNLVFESFDPSTGWDGNYKGKACDPGVFVYYFEALCIDNEKYFEKGNITLIK